MNVFRRKAKLFEPLATECEACAQPLRVIPFDAAVAPGSYTEAEPSGKITCGCGAVGYLRGTNVKAPRAEGQRPTGIQRHFLMRLEDGERHTDTELSDEFDYVDPATASELVVAMLHGWVDVALGGIGGLLARPPTYYTLTPKGRRALARR